MKIQTKKCMFNPGIRDWVLVPVVIEVNSASEFRAAWKDFSTEVRRFQKLTKNAGGSNGQA